MYICVGNLTIIGSDSGLSPGRLQVIIWTNARILIIGPLRVDFRKVLIEMHTFSLSKKHLKYMRIGGYFVSVSYCWYILIYAYISKNLMASLAANVNATIFLHKASTKSVCMHYSIFKSGAKKWIKVFLQWRNGSYPCMDKIMLPSTCNIFTTLFLVPHVILSLIRYKLIHCLYGYPLSL